MIAFKRLMFLSFVGVCLQWVPSDVLAEDIPESAALMFKLENNDSIKYDWNIRSTSESKGREQGKAFTLTNEKAINMMLTLRGALHTKTEGIPLIMRTSEWSMKEKNTLTSQGETPEKTNSESSELTMDKKQIKMTQNGTVKIDSDNDVGLEQIAQLRDYVKSMENSEVRLFLENTGRQVVKSGESPVMEQLKSTAQGIFPILAGRDVKLGETWDDSLQMPKLGPFQLVKPVVVNSKMTFVKWVEKEGQRYANIDIVSSWGKEDLKGENDAGLLVEISHVNGIGAGTCLFDPKTGSFIEGTINIKVSYRIDGEQDGQASGLDVVGTNLFTFTRKK